MRRKHSHDVCYVVSGGVARSSARLDGVRCGAGSGQVLDGGWIVGWWLLTNGEVLVRGTQLRQDSEGGSGRGETGFSVSTLSLTDRSVTL